VTGAGAGRAAPETGDTADTVATGGADAGVATEGADAGRVLIVGYGNALRSDDALGPLIAARLVEDPRFGGATVVAAHQLTPEMAIDVSVAFIPWTSPSCACMPTSWFPTLRAGAARECP